MAFRNLDREWDEVLIIDLLSDDERKQHKISESARELLARHGVHQLQMSCSLKAHVFEALNLALARAGSKSFIIQFTAHGSKFGIGNREDIAILTWEELRSPLSKINHVLNGDLIVNMIACNGIHGLKIDDLMDPASPFFALIGPTRKLRFAEAREICLKFYTKLLAQPQIPLVIKEIIEESNDATLWARSSQAIRDETMPIKQS
jgi:hypothetical protein